MGLRARFLMPTRGVTETYREKVLSYSPIAYWMLAEASGADALCQVNAAQNGAHTGVTLAQPGIGDGETCPLYDGVNDDTGCYTTTFRDAFDPALGSVLAWMKVYNAGVWTDGTSRGIVNIEVGSTNRVLIKRHTDNGNIQYQYRAGGVAVDNILGGKSDTGWVAVGMTWNVGADELKLFYDGAQGGATLTGLGTWVGLIITADFGQHAAAHWNGYLAHIAVWDTALSGDVVAKLSTL